MKPEVLARAKGQKKKRKGIQIRKENISVSLLADGMILYTRNFKDTTKKTLTDKHVHKAAGCKTNTQKSGPFPFTNNKQTKSINQGNSPNHNSHTHKNKISGNKHNQRTKKLQNEKLKTKKKEIEEDTRILERPQMLMDWKN